jgi:hypothetical protein
MKQCFDQFGFDVFVDLPHLVSLVLIFSFSSKMNKLTKIKVEMTKLIFTRTLRSKGFRSRL